MRTKTGTLIGVPIPEQYEEKSKRIQEAVEQAVRESEENGIATRGKEVTPWILARVKELSGGESVESSKQHKISLDNQGNADADAFSFSFRYCSHREQRKSRDCNCS